MAIQQFKAESKRLLDLMIHSIYTNHEIFLRELISNASDATDKLCYMSLTKDKVSLNREDLAIEIICDKENNTLTLSDHGIGMDKQALEDNLGVIAKSGSLQFKQDMASSDENHDDIQDIDIIGQFGVGFYSAFMVSDSVTVITKPHGSDVAYKWHSTGADGYSITECEKDTVGTEIIMTLKADTDDDKYSHFLQDYTLRSLIKKYSNYIRYPIKMTVEKSRPIENESDDDSAPKYEAYTEIETLNDMIPIWHKSKNDITEEETNQFYKDKFFDYENPIKTIQINTEGVISYKSMLFIPAHTPQNYFTKEYEKGLQLYSSGVMIMEKCSDLIPEHFRFVRGVVDSQDLSLNISREMLQQNRQLNVIATSIEKKIKRELLKMLENEREKYQDFFKNFGIQLKYGVVSEYGANKDNLKDLLLFYSSTEQKPVTLAEYISRMKEEQKFIYYACGDSIIKIDKLPQTESIKEKDFEILYLTDEVDDFVMNILREIDGKEIKSVNSDDVIDKEDKEAAEEKSKENKGLLDFMKECLSDKVKEVKISEKLKSHPVCLSSDGSISLEMEKYFSQLPSDEQHMKAERVLEINANHPIFDMLNSTFTKDQDRAKKISVMLYQQAMLIAGFSIDDPTSYTDLVCELLSK